MNKIYQSADNKWYWEDEYGDEIGPFNTHEQAFIAQKAAEKWYLQDHQIIRKMRDNDLE